MNRETARQIIKRQISCKDYLEKSKNGQYCCPYPDCGSGKKKNGTGAVKFYPDTNTWHCFSCGKSGDCIDLYMAENGVDYNAALVELAREINIEIDEYKPNISTGIAGRTNAAINADREKSTETTADYTEYYRQCRERLNDPIAAEYLKKRGISQETAAAYMLGYDPAADPAGSGHPCPRIILPVTGNFYTARAINLDVKRKYMNPTGRVEIFNEQAINSTETREIFITEGIFDALSIIEAGATAIATNSANNAEKLLKIIEDKRPQTTFILAFDADPAGERATTIMKNGLQQANISYTIADICGAYKDPNEALTGDRAAFIDAVERARSKETAKPDNTSLYIRNFMGDDMTRFKREIKFGFSNLDTITVDGQRYENGLYTGLYCLAATSSIGKTTFALQLADQIAAAGNDAIYFSLEQSRLELVTKSLARLTAQADMRTAAKSLDIRKGRASKEVLAAAKRYEELVEDRLSIVELNFDCSVSFVAEYVREYMKRNPGTYPVCVIDYLQIMAPETNTQGRQQTMRESVDNTMTKLKQLSRELNITVIAICSTNRSSYTMPLDFESLKESGGIEFTADCVLGLQLQCMNDEMFNKQNNLKARRDKIKAEKRASPRKVEIVCLKNRYGISSYSAYFDYYPAHDLFVPDNNHR